MPFEMFNDGTSDKIEHWVSKMEQLISEYLADGDYEVSGERFDAILLYLSDSFDANNPNHALFSKLSGMNYEDIEIDMEMEKKISDYLQHIDDGGERDYDLEEELNYYVEDNYDGSPNHNTVLHMF